MAQYQNLFNQVQLRTVPETGVPLPIGDDPRIGQGGYSYWLGKVGAAQVGPIYLGKLGFASLLCGFLAFEIIGLNMFASVNWDPIQFVRQLPWLALEPPAPEYGFTPFVPLAQGGWWIMTGFFLTASVLLVVGAHLSPCAAARHGHARAVGVCERDLAVPGDRLHPAAVHGIVGGKRAVRYLPAPGLDRGFFDPLRQPLLQSVPLPLDHLPVRIDFAVRDARGDHPRDRALRIGPRDRADHGPRHRH
jgi:hypothetical protein